MTDWLFGEEKGKAKKGEADGELNGGLYMSRTYRGEKKKLCVGVLNRPCAGGKRQGLEGWLA
ncbi:hypothetical protein I79_021915 [Cricetulus griseus]|uniref:Uncharacterized protein n=1 Tax=Cricetulus griseus TaxID=10029 RepID=G3IDX6_CRIGR|nr:hypothetical protein I79_021915 [Cricetulus griseus]